MTETPRTVTAKGQPKMVVTDPEYTLSVIGLVASFCGQPLVGLILCIIALRQSRTAGRHNQYGLVGFIISLVMLGLWLLFVLAYAGIIIVSIVLSATGHRG